MTAQEAKQKTIEGKLNLFNKAIKNIDTAAGEGSTSTYFWTCLKDQEIDKPPVLELKEKLIELGYDVIESWSSANNEYKLLINW